MPYEMRGTKNRGMKLMSRQLSTEHGPDLTAWLTEVESLYDSDFASRAARLIGTLSGPTFVPEEILERVEHERLRDDAQADHRVITMRCSS